MQLDLAGMTLEEFISLEQVNWTKEMGRWPAKGHLQSNV